MIEAKREPLLQVQHLKKYFKLQGHSVLKALDDVSFEIYEGETLGLVGESGCGKTTCGRVCIGLYDRTDGQVLYRGQDVHLIRGGARRAFKQKVQMVFQDPYSSLDPRMTVADIVGEGLEARGTVRDKKQRTELIYHYLREVGLNEEHASRFVHEFSGGQRQRIGIARALAVEPEFLVLDEPISALDVSIQAQIVNLLVCLQKEKKLTYLFVAHDLAMVKHISDRIVVMYLGKVMEIAASEELYAHPLHPYTKSLMAAIPIPDPDVEENRQKQREQLKGETSSPIDPGTGCRFCSRCRFATEACSANGPELREVKPGHFVACHSVERWI